MQSYETQHATAARQFVERLEDGRTEDALDAGVTLANAQTPAPRPLLRDVRTALADGDDRTALSLLEQLETAYTAARPEEAVRATLANAGAKALPPGSGDRQFLDGYIQARADAGTGRTQVFATLGLFLSEEETEASRADAIDAVEQLLADELTLSRRGQRLDDAAVATSVELPPTLTITSAALEDDPLATGVTSTVTVDVRNVGTTAATGVQASLELPDALADDSTRSVGELEPDGSARVSLSVEAESPGEYSLGVDATAENASRTSRSLLVTIEDERDDKPGFVLRFDDGNGEIEFDEVIDVIRAFNGNDPDVNFNDVVAVIREFNGDGRWAGVGN